MALIDTSKLVTLPPVDIDMTPKTRAIVYTAATIIGGGCIILAGSIIFSATRNRR